MLGLHGCTINVYIRPSQLNNLIIIQIVFQIGVDGRILFLFFVSIITNMHMLKHLYSHI